MGQPCCGCCCKFNEHNGKVFDETIREIRESKASFNKLAAAPPRRSYRLLSYSARQLQLKTRARQSGSTQGKRCRRVVEAPEAPEAPEEGRQAGRHINRQLSNGQERNLWASSSVAGQDGVLLLQIGSA